ncbi:nucleotide exchange factor GrpE [Candidatus Woesearchaeota archaeon]|nr:nucleotide exchange factor GrpE [Candidatus Woesearchaeota archaeon]
MKPEQKDEETDSALANSEQQQEPEKKAMEYKEALQRLQADFENYRKRVEKEKTDIKKHANAELMKALLPVIDSFELALKSISNADDKLRKGMEMIYGQFYSVLESLSLRPINAAGEMFDPYKHEVLMQEETANEKKDGMVIEEFQKGYMFNDAVLRCSKVKVLKFNGGK